MKRDSYINRIFKVLILVSMLFSISGVFADESAESIQQRIQELNREAEQTTDLNRLLTIATELGELASKLLKAQGIPSDIQPPGRGKTPDEEVNYNIHAINASYERQKFTFAGYRDPNGQLVPFLRARKLHGSIQVRGSNQRLSSETPYNGGVSGTLQYTIREDFVGYLLTTEYYDSKTGKFTDKKDYAIKTISQFIHNPAFGGKECIETIGNNWKACKKWEQYGIYEISKQNEYPAVHDWAMGGTAEDGGIMFMVETPDIIFRTVKKSESRSVGCFGANIFMSNTDFELDIQDNKLVVNQTIGREFGGTPHCGKGSNVTLTLELCKEVPRCEQLEPLLAEITWAIGMRDKFKAMAKVATTENELIELVNIDLNEHYPGLDIQDKEFLNKYAGGYDICSGKTVIPNRCKGCATSPVCRWITEALRVHEKTHELDVLKTPSYKKVNCDLDYRSVTSASKLASEEVAILGDLEYHAYDEQARYLMDILQRELSQSSGCNLPASFYVDLNKAINALK